MSKKHLLILINLSILYSFSFAKEKGQEYCLNETSFSLSKERIKCTSDYDFLCDMAVFSLPNIICKKDLSNNWLCSNPRKSWIRGNELKCPKEVDAGCDYKSECYVQFNPIYTIYYITAIIILLLVLFIFLICLPAICIATQCFFSIEVGNPSIFETHFKTKRSNRIK